MTVSLPLWAYIALLAYSLIFSGLFLVFFAALDAEKRSHHRTQTKLRAEVSYFCHRWLDAKKELEQQDQVTPPSKLSPDLNFVPPAPREVAP